MSKLLSQVIFFHLLLTNETILQPLLSKKVKKIFESFDSQQQNSVLKSYLLPVFNDSLNFPNPYICGFGVSNKCNILAWKKTLIDANTDGSKWSIGQYPFIQEKQNIPSLNGSHKRINLYLKELVKGFRSAYHLFSTEGENIINDKTIVESFKDKKIRYVWRPTYIYANIKQKLHQPEYLSNSTKFGLGIELLARAYLNKNCPQNLISILSSEREQFLKGDIPMFEFYSDSKQMILENNTELTIFETDAVSTFKNRIRQANKLDCNYQIELIKECFKN